MDTFVLDRLSIVNKFFNISIAEYRCIWLTSQRWFWLFEFIVKKIFDVRTFNSTVRSVLKKDFMSQQTTQSRGVFRILRGVDSSADVLSLPQPGDIHFPNAKGGLRKVDSLETRRLARESANRLKAAFEK